MKSIPRSLKYPAEFSSDFLSEMKSMERPAADSIQNQPYTLSSINDGKSGITMPRNEAESQKSRLSKVADAELVVLKAIIIRENHFKTLQDSVRTLQSKYKDEISTILDCIRSSSLEVVESITAWRQEIVSHL
jgi:hypothetical protein